MTAFDDLEPYGLDYLKNLEVGKIIIDTDIGSDDAIAISFALEHTRKTQHGEVIAITCTHGNVGVHHVQNNTIKLLKVLNRLDVSISIESRPRGIQYIICVIIVF